MHREAPQQPEMPPSEPRMWPGKRLRAARESMQMSKEDVARHLHQEVGIITALEEDDYSRLPGHTYVLGYLRSYARLLKLPVNEIVEAVQVERMETASLVPDNIDYDKPTMLEEGGFRWWLYVLILLLSVIVAVWLLYADDPLQVGSTVSRLFFTRSS